MEEDLTEDVEVESEVFEVDDSSPNLEHMELVVTPTPAQGLRCIL